MLSLVKNFSIFWTPVFFQSFLDNIFLSVTTQTMSYGHLDFTLNLMAQATITAYLGNSLGPSQETIGNPGNSGNSTLQTNTLSASLTVAKNTDVFTLPNASSASGEPSQLTASQNPFAPPLWRHGQGKQAGTTFFHRYWSNNKVAGRDEGPLENPNMGLG